MRFKYRDTVLNELARHGVIPHEHTPPELINEFIEDLYRFEIRALKQHMLAGGIRKGDYARHVDELRKRYPILSLPARLWIEPE